MKQMQFDIVGAILALTYIFVPLILGAVHFALKPVKDKRHLYHLFFLYYLIVGVGIQGLVNGYAQLTMPRKVAAYVGWNYSPFLLEVGMANIVFGILGLLCIWIKSEGWRAAVALGYGLFLLFAGVGHVVDMIKENNFSIGNIGPTLWADFLVPLALFILLALRKKA